MLIKLHFFLTFLMITFFSSQVFSLPTHLKNVVEFEHNKAKVKRGNGQCGSIINKHQLDEIGQLVMQMALTDDRDLRMELSRKYQVLVK